MNINLSRAEADLIIFGLYLAEEDLTDEMLLVNDSDEFSLIRHKYKLAVDLSDRIRTLSDLED